MKKVLLVKYGEIALRGHNRKLFENRLIATIKKNLARFGELRISKEQGRLLVERPDGDLDFDEVIPEVLTVLGIAGVCPCVKLVEQGLESLQSAALTFLQAELGDKAFSFKVDTRRANKKYPIPSQEVSAAVGGWVLENMPNACVDVVNPEIKVRIELRNDAYVYTDVIKGVGGLPSGSSGRGTLLLSGGIDSPVAGFLAAKRGVALSAIYFHSPPYTSEHAKIKVCDLAKRLAVFTGDVTLYVIPFTEIQLFLYDRVPSVKLTVFLKRSMLRIAQMIAEQEKSHCLIVGDSIGQVASQTLQAIHAINSACTMPVIRPLAGFDKQEIVDLAKKIGTYETSILPYEDCCTIFVAEHPDLKPKTSVIEGIEAKLTELNDMAKQAAEKAEVFRY